MMLHVYVNSSCTENMTRDNMPAVGEERPLFFQAHGICPIIYTDVDRVQTEDTFGGIIPCFLWY